MEKYKERNNVKSMTGVEWAPYTAVLFFSPLHMEASTANAIIGNTPSSRCTMPFYTTATLPFPSTMNKYPYHYNHMFFSLLRLTWFMFQNLGRCCSKCAIECICHFIFFLLSSIQSTLKIPVPLKATSEKKT